MKMVSIIGDVVADFKQNLLELVRDVEKGDLTAESFPWLVEGLKVASNAAALDAFEKIVQEFEETAEVIEHEGKKHRFKQISEKEWLTPFGLANVPRRYYQSDAGGEGVVPLDLRCGMQGHFMTPDVEEVTAFATALLVPREVEALLGKVFAHGPSTTAIQRVIHDVGSFAEDQTDRVEAAMRKEAPLSDEGDIAVISWDGTTVPLREPGVKLGRPPERPGVRDDQESPTSWKEAGVGTLSIYRPPEGDEEDPVLLDTRHFGRMPESGMTRLLAEQSSVVEDLLESRSLREFAVICDGKPAIWTAAENIPAYENATFILDFYHVSEGLSKAAEAIFGKSTAKATRWHKTYRSRLLEDADGAVATIRSLRYHIRKLRKGSDRYDVVRRLIAHLTKNLDKLDYTSYVARGLPIGSGPVEASCKNSVAARLKRSGMRWSRQGGQEVLNLRVHVLSYRWDVFWNVYQESKIAA